MNLAKKYVVIISGIIFALIYLVYSMFLHILETSNFPNVEFHVADIV